MSWPQRTPDDQIRLALTLSNESPQPQSDRGFFPEIGAYADYWRKIGVEVDEHVTSAAELRDNSVRSQFPGWDIMSAELTGLIAGPAASAENRWTGNRNGFEDGEGQGLAAAFRTSLTVTERGTAMKAINDYIIGQMVVLPTFYQATWMAARKGVKAYDDLDKRKTRKT